jgi:hypothetical protein
MEGFLIQLRINTFEIGMLRVDVEKKLNDFNTGTTNNLGK